MHSWLIFPEVNPSHSRQIQNHVQLTIIKHTHSLLTFPKSIHYKFKAYSKSSSVLSQFSQIKVIVHQGSDSNSMCRNVTECARRCGAALTACDIAFFTDDVGAGNFTFR